MKNSIIIKHIQRSLLIRLIFPLVLLSVSLFLLHGIPLKRHISPRTVDPATAFSSAYDPDNLRVSVDTENLRYTGYDSMKNGSSFGSYYYTLKDGRCQFYLLKSDPQTAPAIVIGQAAFNGFLIPMDSGEYDEITAGIAESIGWTEEGVRSAAEPYMISAIDFYYWKQALLIGILFLCIQIPLFDILLTLFYLIRPDFSRPVRRLSRYGDAKTHLMKAEMEMRHTCLVQTDSIYLTPNYLVNMDRTRTLVVPLDCLAWAYYHGQLHRIFGMRRSLSYTFRLMDINGKGMEFSCGPREPLDKLLTVLSEQRPAMLTGCTEENQRLYREMLLKNK